MEMPSKPTIGQRLKNLFIGRERNLQDKSVFHQLSLVAFFAWVGFGADGISSSCYGPSEAFLALKGHPTLAIFIGLATVLTIFIIVASYNQVVELFPTGGGGYLVASKLLSPNLGMIAGCALLIDYVMTITVSIASGADALFSFLPLSWHIFKLPVAIGGVMVLTILNLRGVKESVMPLVPIFIVFVLTHVFAIVYALIMQFPFLPQLANNTVAEVGRASSELGLAGMLFLMLRAYSMGAGTYTGIEAISNGMSILREPKVETAKRTMRYMTLSLAFMVMGLMLAYLLCSVEFEPGKTLNAVLFHRITALWAPGPAYAFVLITLFSEAAILFVASQAGFFGGPRILANLALDRWAPSRFTMLSDRLVTQNGILIMGIAAAVMMFMTKGSVQFLVVLYSINVFITFVLSQMGMVRHWWRVREKVRVWKRKLMVNGIGLILTLLILVSMVIMKFYDGGWITLIITGSLAFFAIMIKRHYRRTSRMLKRLDSLVKAATGDEGTGAGHPGRLKNKYDPGAKTAVLMVNGFNGLGLHTSLSVIRLFGDTFRNFIFIQVGVVDAGVFKGAEELEHLKQQVAGELERYVGYMRRHGYFAEGISSIGTDVVTEVNAIAPQLLERFPQAIFFGGQLVFPHETWFIRWLHNNTAFALQRSFYYQGIPVVILPIRVE